MLLAEMTTLQLLIVNLPQILMAILGALGIGKTIQEVKKGNEELQKVGGKVQAGNEVTDTLANNVETRLAEKDARLIEKEKRIRELMAENERLKAQLSKRVHA